MNTSWKDLNSDDRSGILIWSIAISLGIIIISFYFYQKILMPDPTTLCIDRYSNRDHYTVIIDKTDFFTYGEVNAIGRYITDEIIQKMDFQDDLEIFILDNDNYVSKGYAIPNPTSYKCKPQEYCNGWGCNPKYVEERYNRFLSVSDTVKTILQTEDQAAQTPIFEMIKSTTERFKSGNNNLFIISDFIHNNDFYSQYNSSSDFNDFKNKYNDYYRTVIPELIDVNVELLYIRRENSDQSLEHENFWKAYLQDNKVSGYRFKRL